MVSLSAPPGGPRPWLSGPLSDKQKSRERWPARGLVSHLQDRPDQTRDTSTEGVTPHIARAPVAAASTCGCVSRSLVIVGRLCDLVW